MMLINKYEVVMLKKKMRAFSLIELLVTMAIVGILSAIAYTSYSTSVVKTKRTEAKTALLKIMQQEEQFFTQNTSYSVFSKASTNPNEMNFRWYSSDAAISSSYELNATACAGDVIQNCVLLTAIPGTSNVNPNFKDSECGNFTITSTGVRGFTGATGTQRTCW